MTTFYFFSLFLAANCKQYSNIYTEKYDKLTRKKKDYSISLHPLPIVHFFFFFSLQDFKFFVSKYLTIIYSLQIETNLFFYFSYENI